MRGGLRGALGQVDRAHLGGQLTQQELRQEAIEQREGFRGRAPSLLNLSGKTAEAGRVVSIPCCASAF